MKKTKKWKGLMLKASKDLLAYYQGKNDKFRDYCPYCETVTTCSRCPWRVFEQTHCVDFVFELGLSRQAEDYRRYRHRSKRWIKARIPMLKRWIKELSK